MSNFTWITDRPPTAADADRYGEVLAQMSSLGEPGETRNIFTKWDQVSAGTPWRQTSMEETTISRLARSGRLWRSTITATTCAPCAKATPRLFTSITYADARYLALADDGTSWEKRHGEGWVQLDPLPAREVGQ